MAFCSFSKEYSALHNTSVENAFIYDYLPQATGNAVKIYLYGLFLCHNSEFDMSVSAFAKELSLSEEEVRDTFLYWEEFGLVSILSEEPFSVRYLPLASGAKPRKIKPEKYAAFSESAQMLIPKRMLSTNEYSEYYSIMETFGIKPEAFLMIIKYCVDLKGEDIGYRYIAAVAKDFGQRKICTPEQVEQELSSYILRTAELEKILKALSLRRKPEIEDSNFFSKWTKELGFETESILTAAKSMKKGSMKKLDEFMLELYNRKMFTKSEIQSYSEKKHELYDLTVKINRALGIYYDVIDTEVDAFVSPWVSNGFDEESLLFIAKYCFKKRKNTPEGMDEVLSALQKIGVISYESIAEYFLSLSRDDKFLSSVLETAGISRKPNGWDRELLKQWRLWNFSEEMILEAAKIAAGKNSPLPYMNSVLGAWKQKGIFSKEMIERSAPQQNAHFHNERVYDKEQLDKLIDNIDEIDF